MPWLLPLRTYSILSGRAILLRLEQQANVITKALPYEVLEKYVSWSENSKSRGLMLGVSNNVIP